MKISFKEKVLSVKEIIKNVFNNYPLTMIIIFLYTIFQTVLIDTKFYDENWVENINIFCVFWGFGTFFSENLIEKRKINKAILYGITGIISIFFANFLVKSDGNFDMINKLSICYITTIFTVSLFIIIKKSKKNISEYLLKVLINFAKITFIYIVLALGILIICEIFDILIYNLKGKLTFRIETLVLGFYYFPNIIYALTDLNEEVQKFFKALVKYVLASLVFISFGIIYIYILKILILKDMPNNQIFRILSALFIVGAPIWTCMQYFKDNSISYKISLKMPIAFIPFIFLQIYTIGIRVLKNGLTPNRYICIALIIFEIIYVLFYIIKKEKLHFLILVVDFIIIFSLIIPVVNMYDLSLWNQVNILKEFNSKSNLSDDDKEKIYGAYYYLIQFKEGKEYIDNLLTDKDKEEIKGFKIYNSNNSSYMDSEYFSFYNEEKVNITGYNNLIDFSCNYVEMNNQDKEKAFSSIKLEKKSEIIAEVDLSKMFNNFLSEYEKNGKESSLNYFKDNNEIILDDNNKIVINSFSLNYNKIDETVEYFSINGYYLEK